jgi:hypothetical protein
MWPSSAADRLLKTGHAEVTNAAQVSLEMGNSPKMVFRHYRELVTEAEAKAWFGISPERTANVVHMPASADHPPKRSTGQH